MASEIDIGCEIDAGCEIGVGREIDGMEVGHESRGSPFPVLSYAYIEILNIA